MVKLRTIRTNLTEFTIGPVTLYFSYQTVVAIQLQGKGLYVSENQWTPTTGRHLTQEFGKDGRVPKDAFNKLVAAVQNAIACALTLPLNDGPGEYLREALEGVGE